MFAHILTILLAAITIHVSDPATWQASTLSSYIGKTVEFDVPIVVCGLDNTSATRGLQVGPQRTFSPTNQAIPLSDEYNTLLNRSGKGCFTLTGYPIGCAQGRRTGEKIYHLQGIVKSINEVQWVSGTWATGNRRADLVNGYRKEDIDMKGEHTLLVCAANLEYYLTEQFIKNGSMGPEDEDEHKKQRAKVSKALALINADIYGLVEIQQGDGALSEIAADLNKNIPGRIYKIIRSNTVASGTYTQSGYIYDSLHVQPIYATKSINDVVQNRKKMQIFEEMATNERFIFSLNHFKAKSGSGTGKDADQGDGQGTYNESRVKEARAVYNQYNTFSNQTKEPDMLIMGDLNAYAYEDPIQVFIRHGMYDLHRYFHADSSYSYTFRNQAGYLDHAIASQTMFQQVTGMTAFHVNSDENDSYTYDKSSDETMFRYSDHDPVLVGLRLNKSLSTDPVVTVNNCEVMVEGKDIIIKNAYTGRTPAFAIITTIEGHQIGRYNLPSEHEVIPKPELPGFYLLSIYDGKQRVNQIKILVTK